MFKIGDVVMLKSGGPRMTVAQIDLDGNGSQQHLGLVWFNGAMLELRRRTYGLSTIAAERVIHG